MIQKDTFGRSMLEMLLVLGIIGVITIGIFFGIRSVMDGIKDNKESKDVLTTAKELSLALETHKYNRERAFAHVHILNNDRIWSIEHSASGWQIIKRGVSKGVCQQLLRNGGNPSQADNCAEQMNTLAFLNDGIILMMERASSGSASSHSNSGSDGGSGKDDPDSPPEGSGYDPIPHCASQVANVCYSCASGWDLNDGGCVQCETIDFCEAYGTNCACSTCAQDYDLSSGQCCPAVTNCSAYDENCVCMGCDEGYSLEAGSVCKKTCTSNADCAENDTFCAFPNADNTDPGIGKCTTLYTASYQTVLGVDLAVSSANEMNWWTAESWCAVQYDGYGRMASKTEIGCSATAIYKECKSNRVNNIVSAFSGINKNFWLLDEYETGVSAILQKGSTTISKTARGTRTGQRAFCLDTRDTWGVAGCTDNGDCKEPGTFCAFPEATSSEKGSGECMPISIYSTSFDSGAQNPVSVNNRLWLHGERNTSSPKSNYWTTENWCLAQGYEIASKADMDCSSDTCSSPTKVALNDAGFNFGYATWLKDGYAIHFQSGQITSFSLETGQHLLCVTSSQNSDDCVLQNCAETEEVDGVCTCIQCATGYYLNSDGVCRTTCDSNLACTSALGNDYFCNYPSGTSSTPGNGQCALLTTFTASLDVSNIGGKSWLHGENKTSPKTNFWSAKSWCEAKGYRLPTREDLGCAGSCTTCNDTAKCCQTSITDALYDVGYTFGTGSWLNEATGSNYYTIGFKVRSICNTGRQTNRHILCVSP